MGNNSTVLGLWNLSDTNHTIRKSVSHEEGKRIIRSAFKSGISSFDTAISYGNADGILSSALKSIKAKRDEYKIYSKGTYLDILEHKRIEMSLRRLNTSYFDVFMLHWPTKDEKILYKTLEELERLKEKGITKEIGVSNFPLPLLKKVILDFDIQYHERSFSLVWNKDIDEERELKINMLFYGVLGFGTLGGIYNTSNRPSDERKSLYFFNTPLFDSLINLLKELGDKHKTTIANVALSFVKNKHPFAIIKGASSSEELKDDEVLLEDDEIKILNELSKEITKTSTSDNVFSLSWRDLW